MRVRRVHTHGMNHTRRASVPDQDDTPMPSKHALSEAEAARHIGMSAAWLKKSRTKRFCQLVDAPSYVRVGARRIVYRLRDLEKWQERHLESVGPHKEMSASSTEGQ